MKHLSFIFITCLLVALNSCRGDSTQLKRAQAPAALSEAFDTYLQAVGDSGQELHSIMVLQDGKVLAEKYFTPDTAHVMHSVSKSFTAAAVGFAVSEGLLSLDTRIVDIFPEFAPEHISDTLARMSVRHLLTMNSGHGTDPSGSIRNSGKPWVQAFLETPLDYEPGTCFCYNSLATYVLSAAVQKLSGERIVDYLEPRLWKPLGIEKPRWDESPEGVNAGGWGLYLHPEDMARMGLCLLGGGRFAGRQVMPADWVEQMTAYHVPSVPAGINQYQLDRRPDLSKETNDNMQGYGYQIWRCRFGTYRASGAYGQFIIVLPERNAVIVTTANIRESQKELDLIWKYLLPVL